MTKKILIIIIIMLFFLTSCSLFIREEPIAVLTLAPIAVEVVLECTVEDFLSGNTEIFEYTGDLSVNSYINEQNHLVINMTLEQQEQLRQYLIRDCSDIPNIDVSIEECTITVYSYKETAKEDFNRSLIILDKLLTIKTIEGYELEEISIKTILKDYATQKTVYTLYWPEDIGESISFSRLDFTSKIDDTVKFGD